VPTLHFAIEAIRPQGVLGAVLGMLADLVIGVFIGAVVLCVVKLSIRLRPKSNVVAADKSA
jgi:hypothetical protein